MHKARSILVVFLVLLMHGGVAHAQWVQTNGPYGHAMFRFAESGANLFAGSDSSGVFLSTNNGASWTAVNTGLTNTHVYSLATSGTNIFAGTSGDRGGVFLSTNNGASWTAVNTGLTYTEAASLAVSGTNLFAGTTGGVFLSTNNGTSWTRVNTGLPHDIGATVFSFAVSGTNIFAGTWNEGVFLSTNNGTNWTAMEQTNAFFIRSLAVSGTNLFVGSEGGGFSLSTNNGASWTRVNTWLTNTHVYSLVVSGTNLFAGTDGGVFLSTNNGASWTAVNTGLTNTIVLALAVSGTNLLAGTGDGVWQRPLSEIITSHTSLSQVVGGPSCASVDVPENGAGYVYFSMLSGADSVAYDGDMTIQLVKSGGQVNTKGKLPIKGLLRITIPAETMGNETSCVFTTPSEIAVGNTLYSITSTPLSFTAKKKKKEFERSWDVFAGGSAGVSGTVGSIGLGASVAAAELSVKGEGGMGLNFKRNYDNNLFMSRRLEAGVGVGAKTPSINLSVQHVGISGGITAELMDKALLGQTLCFTNLGLSEDARKMAQTGYILETLSLGGISLSPVVGIVLTAVVETLNGLSGSSSIFSDAQDEIFWGLGVEGSVGAGVEMNIGDVLKLNFAQANAGFAMNARYTDRYNLPGTTKLAALSNDTMVFKPASAIKIGTTREITQAATFDFTPFSVGLKVKDGVELRSGNFSLYDLGVGAEVGYAVDLDTSNKMEQFEVSLKGGGDVALFGPSRSTYYSTSLLFPPEYASSIRNGSTGLSSMIGGTHPVRLGPTAMCQDGLTAVREALASPIGKPIRVTTTECRGMGLDLNIGIDLEAALGAGLGGQIGINGKYFDEIQYPRKVTDLYPGNMNYLLATSEYTQDMASDNFSSILTELLEGVEPLIKTALLNSLNIIRNIANAGEHLVVEANNKAKELVGSIAGVAEEAGTFIVTAFTPYINMPDIFKPAGERGVRRMYYSTRVVHHAYGVGKTAVEPSGTVLVVVSDVMHIGFVPNGASSSIDTVKSAVALKMVMRDSRLISNEFTPEDKNKVRIYFYDKATQNWVLEGGATSADTLSFKTNRMGSYALGIEVDKSNDVQPPEILDYGPSGMINVNTPMVFAKIKDDYYGRGIDYSRTFLIMNSDTLEVSRDPSTSNIFWTPPKPIENGTYSVTVIAADFAGNTATKEFAFTVNSSINVDEKKPFVFKVEAPYPNPFNPSTTIQYEIPIQSHVDLIIYDVTGRKVAILKNSMDAPGVHEAVWNGKNDNGTAVGSGVYLYGFKADKYMKQGKMLLIK